MLRLVENEKYLNLSHLLTVNTKIDITRSHIRYFLTFITRSDLKRTCLFKLLSLIVF